MHHEFEDVELGFIVNLQVLKEVLRTLSTDGKRFWVASDPQDAEDGGYLTIGHGDPRCKDRLNTLYFRIPVVTCEIPQYQRARVVLLFDENHITAESPGFYDNDGILSQSDFRDFRLFFDPIRAGLVARLGAGE